MTWRQQAACRGKATDLFFPVGTTGSAEQQIEEAKEVCSRCPVTQECLQWAVSVGADYGVWGGLSEPERRSWKRSRTRRRRPQPIR